MNLEPVTQSEVSQKEKSKYGTLTQMQGMQKNSIDEPIFRERMKMKVQRMDLWIMREEKSGMNRESSNGQIYNTMCKIDS